MVPLRMGFLYGQTANSAEPSFLENLGSVQIVFFVRQKTNVNGARVSSETLFMLRVVFCHTKTDLQRNRGFQHEILVPLRLGFCTAEHNPSESRVFEKPRFRCNRVKPINIIDGNFTQNTILPDIILQITNCPAHRSRSQIARHVRSAYNMPDPSSPTCLSRLHTARHHIPDYKLFDNSSRPQSTRHPLSRNPRVENDSRDRQHNYVTPGIFK